MPERKIMESNKMNEWLNDVFKIVIGTGLGGVLCIFLLALIFGIYDNAL